jgi:hypothetical protein
MNLQTWLRAAGMMCIVSICFVVPGRALAGIPPPVPDNVAKAQAARVKVLEQRFASSFRQMYKMELHLMRLTCQPSKQQFERIAADGEPALHAAIKEYVQRMTGRVIGPRSQSDPRKPIVDALLKSVRAVLSPEQAARYQKELELRAAARKRMALRNLVAKLDKVLLLTPQQREQLSKILESHWTDSFNDVRMFQYGQLYFPKMPEQDIVPILTSDQKEVWNVLHKRVVNFGFYMSSPSVDVGDEVWNEAQPPFEQKEQQTEPGNKQSVRPGGVK